MYRPDHTDIRVGQVEGTMLARMYLLAAAVLNAASADTPSDSHTLSLSCKRETTAASHMCCLYGHINFLSSRACLQAMPEHVLAAQVSAAVTLITRTSWDMMIIAIVIIMRLTCTL